MSANVKIQPLTLGRGGPAVVASGTMLPADGQPDTLGGQLTLTLLMNEEALARGRRVMEFTREAIKKGTSEEGIRSLGRLVFEFPEIVLRVPEFWGFMDRLVASDEDGAIRRIMGEAGRGRRREHHFYIVGLVDLLRERHGWPIAKAAQWIEEHHTRLMKSARSIQNDYSRYKDLYDAHNGTRYVPESELTEERWSRPQGR